MVLKMRVGVPLVWRSPSSLQFGVDAPLAVLEELDEGTERIVAALVSGISRSGFDMMARSLGLDVDTAEELLARLEPVLAAGASADSHRVVVTGDGPLADELRRLLATEGLLTAPDDPAPELAVIVAGWLIGAEDHGTWLRRDIPHLPVVVGDAGVTVGPFVEPGAGPCLYCVQLTTTDRDAAWPAIATQLWSRPAPPLGELAVAEAAAFAARRIRERLESGEGGSATSWRLAAATGEISSRGWTRHAECRCAAPAESDWAPAADHASRPATRRAAADAVLA
jgi:bacteriocin biosynthesis cyclodehydratase domain-containing protein